MKEKLNLEKAQPSTSSMPSNTRMLNPVFDKKTGAIFFPHEKKYMKINKDDKPQEVEFMSNLNRDRMQLRVKNPQEWLIGEKLSIKGDGITYICVIKSIRKNKVVIRKIDEIEEKEEKEPLKG